MRVGIMQPYFLPYIGYFQLINSVDKFVLYDNIEFSKKGWFHRNRILVNNVDKMFSLPLKKDSDYLDVRDRYLSEDSKVHVNKILRQIKNTYLKAPFFDAVYPIIEKIFLYQESNLFLYIYHSLTVINSYLEIETPLIISSDIAINHEELKGQAKVLSIVKSLNGNQYINAIGGIDLYDKAVFEKEKIKLNFIKSDEIKYIQFNNEFVPWLSIIDVMMFNSVDEIKTKLGAYSLI